MFLAKILFVSPSSNIEAPERDRAVEWLKELLAGGQSKPSNEIFKLAEEQGFKEMTLQRARKEIGVKCFPEFDEEGNKSWHWRLPKDDDNKKKTSIFDNMPKMPKLPKLPIQY